MPVQQRRWGLCSVSLRTLFSWGGNFLEVSHTHTHLLHSFNSTSVFVLFCFSFPCVCVALRKEKKEEKKKRELFLRIAVANSSPCSLSSFPPLTLFFVLCGLLSSPAAAAAVVITATVALLRTALFYTISATTYTKAPRSHILSLLFSTLISLFFFLLFSAKQTTDK